MKRLPAILFVVFALSPVPALAAVSGVAISAEGIALPDVKVTAYAQESSAARRERLIKRAERAPLASAVTDAKGIFTVDVKVAPVFDLTFSRPGYAPSTLRVTSDENLGAALLRPAEERIGSIRSNQKPVQGALVVITARDGSEMMLRTDEGGRYSAPDPESWAETMTILHDDFARLDVHRQFRTKWQMDASLTRGARHSGSIVAMDGKTVVAGAMIFVDGWPAGESGDDGTISLDRLPAKWNELRAFSDGLSGSQMRKSSPSSAIRMMPASKLSGHVTAARGGTIAGAMVLLSHNVFEVLEWTITDSKGYFTFPSIVSETLTVSVRMPGYRDAESEVSIAAGAHSTRTLTLDRTGSVDGIVVDENQKPVAAARVTTGGARELLTPSFGDHQGFSDPSGRFLIRSVPPSMEYELEASKKGYARIEQSGPEVAAGERKSNVRIVLQRGYELAGRVTDKRGKPVAGAAINTMKSTPGMTDSWMLFFFAEQVLPMTQEDGTFSIRLTEGSYDIDIRREGFVAHRSGNIKVSPQGEPLEIVLNDGVRIAGRIVKANGTPVANAGVHLNSDKVGPLGSASSAEDGTFIIDDLPDGKLTLQVIKPSEFILLTEPVTAPAANVVITVPGGGAISGRVIDENSKKPISSFSAGIWNFGNFGGDVLPTMKEFRSDDGSFVLENVPAGQHDIHVKAAGYVTARISGVTVETEKAGEPFEVIMAPGVRVTGKVTGPDGSGLADVTIHPADPLSIEFADRLVDFVTGPEGEYVLENMPAGERPLLFRKNGYVPGKKTVTISGKEMRVDVTLSRGLELKGSVVDTSGMPVAGASVSAWSPVEGGDGSSTSGADGAFRIEGLAPGRYTIGAFKAGLTRTTLRDIDIRTAAPLRLLLSTGGTVYGRVTGHEESQRSRIVVSADGPDGGGTASIDAAGNFRIEGVSPGQVRVNARSGSGITVWKRVELQESQSLQVDLEFRKEIVISGRVTRKGQPVGLAQVTFVPRDRHAQTFAIQTTDGDGFYSVAGLGQGEYNVEVVDRNRAGSYGTTYTVRSSNTFDIEIKGATLRGRVIDADSREGLAEAGLSLTSTAGSGHLKPTSLPSGLTGWDGSFELQNLPPGRYQLRVQKNGWGHQVRDISVGDLPQNESFELTKAVGIILRVIDARDGRPLVPQVLAMDAAQREAFSGGGVTATDGSVSVSLGKGPYRLTVEASGYATRTISAVAPGEASVALTPGGTIQVTLRGSERAVARLLLPSGEPYLRSAWRSTTEFTLNPGVNALANIMPGNYTLEILDDTGQSGKTEAVTVTDGQMSRVTL